MPRVKSEDTAYVIKITLTGSKPPIWRRLCVPGEITLDRLHDVIQIIMGWQECHLHCFEIGGQRYTEAPEDVSTDGQEEGDFRLCDLVPRAKTKFSYEYDFGDRWQHTLIVDAIDAVPTGHRACVGCLDGKRSCPPEDVGGLDRYYEFLAALDDPQHPEHEGYQEWCGGHFDPKAFDIDEVNLELGKYVWWSRPRRLSQALLTRGFSDL